MKSHVASFQFHTVRIPLHVGLSSNKHGIRNLNMSSGAVYLGMHVANYSYFITSHLLSHQNILYHLQGILYTRGGWAITVYEWSRHAVMNTKSHLHSEHFFPRTIILWQYSHSWLPKNILLLNLSRQTSYMRIQSGTLISTSYLCSIECLIPTTPGDNGNANKSSTIRQYCHQTNSCLITSVFSSPACHIGLRSCVRKT